MEIERKFLVDHIPFNLEDFDTWQLEQGYVHTTPTIRIRKKDNQYILTLKSSGTLQRHELEMPLSKNEYESLYKKVTGHIIKKTRYLIPLDDGKTAELDIFEGDLAPLKYVEVEFNTTDDANNFLPPKWFGKEVTEDYSYTNQALAMRDLK